MQCKVLHRTAIWSELSEVQWRSVFRQLMHRGLISVDMDDYGSLKLTIESRPILRGGESVCFRKNIGQEKKRKKMG